MRVCKQLTFAVLFLCLISACGRRMELDSELPQVAAEGDESFDCTGKPDGFLVYGKDKSLLMMCSGGALKTISGKGEQGPVGAPGQAGAAGAQGQEGPAGPRGALGPTGETGARGEAAPVQVQPTIRPSFVSYRWEGSNKDPSTVTSYDKKEDDLLDEYRDGVFRPKQRGLYRVSVDVSGELLQAARRWICGAELTKSDQALRSKIVSADGQELCSLSASWDVRLEETDSLQVSVFATTVDQDEEEYPPLVSHLSIVRQSL